MTEIFFSYSSKDRERLTPVHATLVAKGFDVFWDQEVPLGTDWDTWIRGMLSSSKCTMVFWSRNSILSKNVRHEAAIASKLGRIIPIAIDPLDAHDFPMGLYTEQMASLHNWTDWHSASWQAIERSLVDRLTPPWMRTSLEEMKAELASERVRLLTLESRERALHGQIGKEAATQIETRRNLHQAVEALQASELRQQSLQAELDTAQRVFLAKLDDSERSLRDQISEERANQLFLRTELEAAINASIVSDQKRLALQAECDALHHQYLKELDNIRSSVRGVVGSSARAMSQLHKEFYGKLRKDNIPLTIYLINGVKHQGVVEACDGDNIILSNATVRQIIYIDAIAVAMPGVPLELTVGQA